MSRRRRSVGARPPALVVTIAIVGLLAFFVAPLAGLLQRAPWGQFWSIFTEPDVRTALRLSLECSFAATGLSLVFGLPIAWLLARTEFWGKSIVARDRDPADGAPTRRGRRRVARRVRAPRAGGAVPRPLVQHHAAVHDHGRDHRRDVRCDALLDHHGRGRASAPSTRATKQRARHSARADGRCCGASRCPRSRRRSRPAPRSRGPAHSASSARRSPSPATSRASRRRCRSPCTSRSRTTPAPRSCSASCCSPCRSWCWRSWAARVFGARPIGATSA